MRVVVFGAGYVGMVTGLTFSFLGNPVTLVDINAERTAMIQSGIPPIYEEHIDSFLRQARTLDLLNATTEPGLAVTMADVVFIAVNTPSLASGEADMTYVREAAVTIGRFLSNDKRQVVITKSTVPIGSANLVRVWIEDGYRETFGHPPSPDRFAIASNPEFLREGQAFFDSFYPDRIVFGADLPWAGEMVREIFDPIIHQTFTPPEFLPRPARALHGIPVASADLISAEMIKYAANAFLAMKISFSNEMAQIAELIGADITTVMDGIGLDHRIGRDFLQAGVGWGGSCFGKDISALIHTAKEYALDPCLLEATLTVNRRQRYFLVKKLQRELKTLKGRRISILGLAFKPGTDDLRDSPAETIIRDLNHLGSRVSAYDPVAMANAREQWPELDIYYANSANEALNGAEAVVIVTDWPEFQRLDWEHAVRVMDKPLVIDGRNLLDAQAMSHWGYQYYGVGR